MADTLGDILTRLSYRLGENSAVSDTNEKNRRVSFINEGQRRVYMEDYFWFMRTTGSDITVANQENYTLPSDYRDMIELRVNDRVVSPIKDTDVWQSYYQPPKYYNNSANEQFYVYGDNELHIVPRVSSAPSSFTVSSITRSGITATVTTSSAHGYSVNQYVAISGADQSDYNDSFRITSVPSTTTFTVEVSNSPTTPATGTITCIQQNIVYRYWNKHVALTNDSDTVLIPPSYTDMLVAYAIYRMRGSMRGKYNIAKDAADEFNDILKAMVKENNRRKFMYKEVIPTLANSYEPNDYTVTN